MIIHSIYPKLMVAIVAFLFIIQFSSNASENVQRHYQENPLLSNWVPHISQDIHGNMWFSGGWGACYFDGYNWNYIDSTNSGIPNDVVRASCKDGNGNVWISLMMNGLIKFNKNGYENLKEKFPDIIGKNVVRLEYNNNTNSVYLISEKGSYKFDGENWIELYEYGISLNYIIDEEGIVWWNEQNIICHSDNGNVFCDFNNSYKGKQSRYYNFAIDKIGNKYLSTEHGIMKYDGKEWKKIEADFIEDYEKHEIFAPQIICDKENNLWALNSRGKVVKFLDGRWHFKGHAYYGNESRKAEYIFFDKKGHLWVGTGMHGVFEIIDSSIVASVYNENRKLNSNFDIYPNPATDFITISIPEINHRVNPMVDKVQIFDMLGLEVLSVGIGLDLSTQKIDVSHLPAGVYIIRIGNIVEKFVKM
ncbi:MAG: T9SS type A sorting domain-containing protein [Ignavibacteriae bacterium]|nr:T9SS type A sorting domain-containing protein [Ignavibacteriota bacterium]